MIELAEQSAELARKSDENSICRKVNFHKLPQYLQDYWNEPTNLVHGSSWFDDAAKYIDFPHPELLAECWTDGKRIENTTV